MPTCDFDFENLKTKTFQLLDEMKNVNDKEINKEKVSSLWKNIECCQISKEQDVSLYKYKYEHSEETTMYLMLYHLFETNNEDVVDLFMQEYNGKYKKFMQKCINNYKEFVCYTRRLKEGNFDIEEFISQNEVSNTLKFYFYMYKFIIETGDKYKIRILNTHIKPIIKEFKNEVKEFLPCIINKDIVEKKKQKIENKVKSLFNKEFCKVKNFVPCDFLPMIFEQGVAAYEFLQKNDFAFKNFNDIVLPIEIPLVNQKYFHNLFVCPVIKEVCSDDNKPVLLECNHVLSLNAANVLSKYGTVDVFKCPYCPVVSAYDKLLKLNLY